MERPAGTSWVFFCRRQCARLPLRSCGQLMCSIRDPQASKAGPKTKSNTSSSVNHQTSDAKAQRYEALKAKRAWDLATSPAKQLPMQLVMVYFSGGGVQIFSMGMVAMLLSSPFKAWAGMNEAFAPFAPVDAANPRAMSTLWLQKVAYILCNILTLVVGAWKCNQMGLLPVGTGDWLAFESRGEPRNILLLTLLSVVITVSTRLMFYLSYPFCFPPCTLDLPSACSKRKDSGHRSWLFKDLEDGGSENTTPSTPTAMSCWSSLSRRLRRRATEEQESPAETLPTGAQLAELVDQHQPHVLPVTPPSLKAPTPEIHPVVELASPTPSNEGGQDVATQKSPMTRIPDEILRALFLLFTPTKHDLTQMKFIRQICKVNRRWRLVAEGTSALWTWVTAPLGRGFHLATLDSFLYSLELQLQRSGTQLLRVFICAKGLDTTQQHMLLTTFGRHGPTSRWRTFSAHSLDMARVYHFRDGFGNLDKLDLQTCPNDVLMSAIEVSAPKLRCLESHGLSRLHTLPLVDEATFLRRLSTLVVDDRYPFSLVELPPTITRIEARDLGILPMKSLKHIRYLVLEFLYLDDLQEAAMPRLEYLQCQLIHFNPKMSKRFHFERLKHLIINGWEVYSLKWFTAPALETMELVTGGSYAQPAMSQFPFRSGDYQLNPTTLVLGMFFGFVGLQACLQAAHNVLHLTVHFPGNGSLEELAALLSETRNKDRPSVCPTLSTLRFELGWTERKVDTCRRLASKIIQARVRCPLISVTYSWSNGVELILQSEQV